MANFYWNDIFKKLSNTFFDIYYERDQEGDVKKVVFLTQFQKSAFYICLKSFIKLSRFEHTDFNIQKQSPRVAL